MTKKPFAGERFIFADSRSLGPAPWKTSVPSGTDVGGIRNKRWRNWPAFLSLKRRLQLFFISFGVVLLAYSAAIPCYVAVATCYTSQVICEIDRAFLASLSPVCRLALAAHSPEQLFHTHSETCPTSLLWAVKPNLVRTFGKIWKYTAISINRNYASLGGGARIIRGYTSKTHNLPSTSLFGFLAQSFLGFNPQYASVKGAGIILEEDTSVGECWCMSGAVGHFAVQLPEAVFISHIALDYPSPELLSEEDVSRAPQNMSLWVLLPLRDARQAPTLQIRPHEEFKFKTDQDADIPPESQFFQALEFKYDVKRPPTRQVFPFPLRMPSPSQTIILEVKSNEGGTATCIYWLGIYGMKAAD